MDKTIVITELNKQLTTKLKELNNSLNEAIESRNSDTKSSAGDKFETSREMAQIEIRKIETEIIKTKQFIHDLSSKPTSLITTNSGVFFIAIPFGKLMLKDKAIFCISNIAPISKELLNAKVNSEFTYGSTKYKIFDI